MRVRLPSWAQWGKCDVTTLIKRTDTPWVEPESRTLPWDLDTIEAAAPSPVTMVLVVACVPSKNAAGVRFLVVAPKLLNRYGVTETLRAFTPIAQGSNPCAGTCGSSSNGQDITLIM